MKYLVSQRDKLNYEKRDWGYKYFEKKKLARGLRI